MPLAVPNIVDSHLLDGITELIEKYLVRSLNIQNAKVMISDRVDGEVGLLRHSLKGLHGEIVIPLKKDDGTLYGQSALAFEKKKALSSSKPGCFMEEQRRLPPSLQGGYRFERRILPNLPLTLRRKEF